MERIKLSDKGADELVKLLDTPPEPNPYLIAAKKRYDEQVESGEELGVAELRLERSLQRVKDDDVFERDLIEDDD